MFEPQGTGFFLLLMVVFAALIVWVAMAKQVVFRVLAACLAFVPAMAFGVASVNKFYDYYQTWGGMVSDLTGQGANAIPKYAVAGAGSNKQFDKDIGRVTSTAEDAQVGYLFQTTVTGPRSHLVRDVYVYLPPQYFQKAYAHYKFPVIELLHGSPGNPEAWVAVLDVIPTFLSLLVAHPSDAAVLVMPDTDGGQQYALQCLNDPGGIQDMTFVAEDVPNYIARFVRVQPPGRAWGVAGVLGGRLLRRQHRVAGTGPVRRRRRHVRLLRPHPEPGAGGQQARREAVHRLRVRRAPGAAARQHTECVHHQGAAQRPASCLLARGRSAGHGGRQRGGELPAAGTGPAAAADPAAASAPAGARAVRDHSGRRPSGQRVACRAGPDARLDDSAAGRAGRGGGRGAAAAAAQRNAHRAKPPTAPPSVPRKK